MLTHLICFMSPIYLVPLRSNVYIRRIDQEPLRSSFNCRVTIMLQDLEVVDFDIAIDSHIVEQVFVLSLWCCLVL